MSLSTSMRKTSLGTLVQFPAGETSWRVTFPAAALGSWAGASSASAVWCTASDGPCPAALENPRFDRNPGCYWSLSAPKSWRPCSFRLAASFSRSCSAVLLGALGKLRMEAGGQAVFRRCGMREDRFASAALKQRRRIVCSCRLPMRLDLLSDGKTNHRLSITDPMSIQ